MRWLPSAPAAAFTRLYLSAVATCPNKQKDAALARLRRPPSPWRPVTTFTPITSGDAGTNPVQMPVTAFCYANLRCGAPIDLCPVLGHSGAGLSFLDLA